MLGETFAQLFRKYRLFCYRKLFAAVREKPGSLSATEAFSADIIHLLGSPTVSQFALTIGISKPNATSRWDRADGEGLSGKARAGPRPARGRADNFGKIHRLF